ncbi:MAG: sulfatase [Thermoanaerobaculales bacterium]|nr:sulfatase [Thermoanaerobaculales bacterium]
MDSPRKRLLSHSPVCRGEVGKLVLTLAMLGAAACGSESVLVESLDLVAEGRLEADGKLLAAHESFFADETWVSVTMWPGVHVTAEVDLHREPVLELAGAMTCRDSVPVPRDGTLDVELGLESAPQLGQSIPVDPSLGWWQDRVDLAPLAGKRVTIGLEARLPEGCALLLREATVRQLVRAEEPAKKPPMQVLLVSVDTLRNDAAGRVFGGDLETPNLDQLTAEAEVWTAHYAAANWTKPSHASMLTGYDPATHRAQLRDQAMDPAIPTLADRFRVAGFSTSAMVFDCGWLSPRWGFAKGFDSYQVNRWRTGRQARAAANWVLEHREKPFFFFLHTFEPHSDLFVLPYEAPGVNQRTIAEKFGVQGFGCRQGLCSSEFLQGLVRGEVPLEAEDVGILRDTYDDGVRYLDASLGSLFDALRTSGVWDQMLVVVTSDHGEEFSEHGSLSHTTLYDEIVRVPLLIKWPGSDHGGVVNRAPCSAVDLAPTLLEFAGLPTVDLPGSSLHRRDEHEPVFIGTLDRAVVVDGYKAIFDDAAGTARLFHLVSDAGEKLDLAASDPDRLRPLEELVRARKEQALALHRKIGSGAEGGEVVMSPAERERLEAFGYLKKE